MDDPIAYLATPGLGLVVAAVDVDGRPYASRGWGARVDSAGRLRIAVDGTDPLLLAALSPGGQVAVTAADIRTLEGVQLKGEVVAVEDPAPVDAAVIRHHTRIMFTTISELDGIPIELLERMCRTSHVMCVVDVRSAFVQTPGPGAGRPAFEVGAT